MTKFKKLMTTSGPDLIAVRAENKEKEMKEAFEAEKLETEKEIRELKAEITEMEDLGACTTDALVVAEKVNSTQWARDRINKELELNDLNIELDIINKLIKEYFVE
jgi:hypothetical protein